MATACCTSRQRSLPRLRNFAILNTTDVANFCLLFQGELGEPKVRNGLLSTALDNVIYLLNRITTYLPVAVPGTERKKSNIPSEVS